MFNSFATLWTEHSRLLCPFPGKNPGVDCHFLLQGSFQPRDQTCKFDHHRQILYLWATREAKDKTVICYLKIAISFPFYFILIFYLLLFSLYNIVLVLPYSNMPPPWVYMCSPSWTPLPPPSLYHPSGSSQCTSPEHPVSCSNLYQMYQIKQMWRSVSHMIFYMFQCHSPISSHPHPLPQSPKDCSTHLCLFCCLAYRVIITFFLNSIYMC